MPQRTFPFETQDVFFLSLEAKRDLTVPEDYSVDIQVGARATFRKDRSLQLKLVLSSGEAETPVTFSATVVGQFRATEDFQAVSDDEVTQLIEDFCSERAMGILWGYADLTIRHMLTSMGVNVVKVLPETNIPNLLGSATVLLPSAE